MLKLHKQYELINDSEKIMGRPLLWHHFHNFLVRSLYIYIFSQSDTSTVLPQTAMFLILTCKINF